MRHPATQFWSFPDPNRPPWNGPGERVNLRELAARPGRFEHHLVVLGQIGTAQFEMATASEPLYFAHANITDEYAAPLPTGDPLFDSAPFRTFISNADDHSDVGRVNHRTGDLVLHPHGYLHWPGRLRPPYDPPAFPGPRRAGLSMVFCGCRPEAPHPERPLGVPADREQDAKGYVQSAPPFLLRELLKCEDQVLARVGGAELTVRGQLSRVDPGHGAYLVVLDPGSSETVSSCDLLYLPPGQGVDFDAPLRALVMSSNELSATPPTEIWREVPSAPFAVAEEAPQGNLPVECHGVQLREVDETRVVVRIGSGEAEVPRYWMARFLFRLALHGFQLGYLETYGGFYYDDRDCKDLASQGATTQDAGFRLGLRGGDFVQLSRAEIAECVEQLYRAVAPPNYREHLQ